VSRRAFGFIMFAALICAGCVRLGFWQLRRLDQRRALNAMLSERLSAAARPVRDVARDTAAAPFRRATAAGTYDFANEFALAARTRQGSPGANIVTPLRFAGTDTAVLVNRGWVYAPDAMTVDFARWREPDAATISGYLVAIERGKRGAVSASTDRRVLRHLDVDSLAARLPYPVLPFVLVAMQPATAADTIPARLPAPVLDEGPHLGYAIQWFAFALIGVVGGVFAVRADRRGTWRRTAVPRRGSQHAL
jgi:surfeit locus 1 family protein